MRKEAREWLSKAESDADAAEYNIKGQYYEVAAFLCQQAAEKALKAIYINDFGELVKTHDLHFLGKRTNLQKIYWMRAMRSQAFTWKAAIQLATRISARKKCGPQWNAR